MSGAIDRLATGVNNIVLPIMVTIMKTCRFTQCTILLFVMVISATIQGYVYEDYQGHTFIFSESNFNNRLNYPS